METKPTSPCYAIFCLAVEHTWGTDTKTWLDFNHYTPHDLAQMLDTPKYKVVTHSWEEKREDLALAVASLPNDLRNEAQAKLQTLRPTEPRSVSMKRVVEGKSLASRHFTIALDPHTGAITTMRQNTSGRNWASPEHPLALFSYQTLSKADYDVFLATYLTTKEWWAPQDFGKPNIEQLRCRQQNLASRSHCYVAAENMLRAFAFSRFSTSTMLKASAQAVSRGPTACIWKSCLPDNEPVAEINFSWFDKASNRMPEALWLTFQPIAPEPHGWTMEKVGQPVSPLEVITSGNRHMHALSGPMTYKDPQGDTSQSNQLTHPSSLSANARRFIFQTSSPTSRRVSTSACTTMPGEQTTFSGSAKICASASACAHNFPTQANKRPAILSGSF